MEQETTNEGTEAVGAECAEGSMGVPEPVPEGRIARWADKKAKGSFDPESARRKLAWNRDGVDRLGRGMTYLFLLMFGVVLGAAGWVVAAIEGLAWLGSVIVPFYAVLGIVAGRWWLASSDRYDYEMEVWRRSVKGAEDSELYNDMHLAGELRAIASDAPNMFGTQDITENQRAAIRTAADRLAERGRSE